MSLNQSLSRSFELADLQGLQACFFPTKNVPLLLECSFSHRECAQELLPDFGGLQKVGEC